MTLVLIRHGETQANREHRYLGKTDEPLSGSGREKLLAYLREHRYPKVQYLFTSPMKRCLETAGLLYPGLRPTVIPEWEEMDFGRFEYKSFEDLKHDPQYQAWIDSGGVMDFPEGEGRGQFMARCELGFARMCEELRLVKRNIGEPARTEMMKRNTGEPARVGMTERNTGEPVRVGMIVHGGTIMALLSGHGGKEYFDCQVPNGGGYLCEMKGLGHSAVIFGEVRI